MTLIFIIISPEVSCRPMLGPVRARGWRGSKPLCGFLDIGVPLEVSQKVGKRAKKEEWGGGKKETLTSSLLDSIQIRIRFYIRHSHVLLSSKGELEKTDAAICEKWQSKHLPVALLTIDIWWEHWEIVLKHEQKMAINNIHLTWEIWWPFCSTYTFYFSFAESHYTHLFFAALLFISALAQKYRQLHVLVQTWINLKNFMQNKSFYVISYHPLLS